MAPRRCVVLLTLIGICNHITALLVGAGAALRGSQHRTQVPDHLQPSVDRRDFDPFEEPTECLSRGITLLIVFE